MSTFVTKRLGWLATLAISIALSAALVPSAGLSAQSTSGTPAPTAAATAPVGGTCTLAAADCTLLAEANANLAGEKSFTQKIDFSFKLNDKNQLDLTATGGGPFLFDSTQTLPGFQTQIDLTTTDNVTQKNGALSVVISGGKLYFKTATAWQDVSLTSLLNPASAAASATPAATQAAPDTTPGVGAALNDPQLAQSLAALSADPGVISVARSATDATLSGQTMAQFVYTVDVQKLLQSPDFEPIVKDLLKVALIANGKSGAASKLNDRTIKGALALLSRALNKTTLTITRWVGVTDHMFHAIDVEMGISARFNPLPTAKALTGSLHLLVTLDAIGTPVTITVPTASTSIDPSKGASKLIRSSGLFSGPIGTILGALGV